MSVNRILIVGPGRAGKDTAALMLSTITKIPYAGSTSWAAKELVARALKIHPMVAWETRHKYREDWKRICDKFRENNQTALIHMALESVNEDKSQGIIAGWRGIVTGVRDSLEMQAAKQEKIFDHILWIDRPGIPVDSTLKFEPDECDDMISNQGTLENLHTQVFLWAEERGLIPGLYLSPSLDKFRE